MVNVAYPVNTFSITPFLVGTSLILVTAVSALAYFLIGKSEEYKELKASFDKMINSFNELDEQAKLIVKTDLELNKTQEELDRRLKGLNTLQKLSRTMSMTLDEQEIFQKINKDLLSELGFASALVLTNEENGALLTRVNIGIDPSRQERIQAE